MIVAEPGELLSNVNLVILARSYNPSIVSKEWLYQKGILTDEVTNFTHAPPLSFVETEGISFVIDESRLQISLKKPSTHNLELLPQMAIQFVSSLPETPFTAVGFNYSYEIPKEASRIETLLNPDKATLNRLFSKDCEVGLIASFAFEGSIARVSAVPSNGETSKVPVSFNFHFNTSNADEVQTILNLHSKTVEKAEEIVRGLYDNEL